MSADATLARGRDHFRDRDWAGAHADLAAAAAAGPLEPEDLERLALAAYLVARDADSAEAWEAAHQGFLARGEAVRAARCAFWLGFGLLRRGDAARGGGWLARAQRLADDGPPDSAEHGYLLVPAALGAVAQGDYPAALDRFTRAAEIGERHAEADLVMLARHGQGRALLRMGEVARGAALLDEAMVGVTAGEVSAAVAGIIYCSVIEACHEVFDLGRAAEWTDALTRWCAAQPGLVPYRGQCLIHRAQILQLHGAWADAAGEAEAACDHLSDPPGQPALGMAYYQRGELHRLRGELTEAEDAYRLAAQCGRDPQPGLALLRLAEGRPDTARGAVRRALDEADDAGLRLRLLAAAVEIALPGDLDAARAAAQELADIAETLDAPYARAVGDHAAGAVLLAGGDPGGALPPLRRARAAWERLEAPYEAARAAALLAEACRALGDTDGASLHSDAADGAFRRLGAAPDLAALRRPPHDSGGGMNDAGLSPRELEVLRLLAGGQTNRDIAASLVISQHTVGRHVQNIFAKLGVTSRTAAAAYAFDHHLA